MGAVRDFPVCTGGGAYDEARRAPAHGPCCSRRRVRASSKIDAYDTNGETLLQLDRAGGLAPIPYASWRCIDPAAAPRAQ